MRDYSMHANRLFVRLAICFVLAAGSAESLLAQQSWASGTFSYDAAGNITAVGSDAFYYDTAGRLVHGTADGAANYQDYSYDGFGNRLTAATTGSNCTGNVACGGTVSVNTNNRITTAGFSYDAAGNLLTSGGNTYGYDGAGMMSSLTAPNGWRYDYIYTADDERIATYTGDGNWQFTIRSLDGKVLREMTAYQPPQGSATWTWSRDHVWRDGQLLATVSPSGTQQFHLDHLGTPRVLTDATGHKIGYHAYYPFGEELNLATDESPAERLKFTGHERDTTIASSLDYMHARYYTASMGRFLSVDPLLPKGAMQSPQMWNRYSYVANNPMNRTDPDGKLLQIAGCGDTKSETCQTNYNLYLSTFGKQSQDAAKYLQLGKNGIVSFKGISGAAFGAKFGTMGRASNFLISNRSATFSISTDASRVDHEGGNYATTRYGNVGAEIAIDLAGYPQKMGGITQSATGALAHELGHALGTLLPGIRDAFDAQLVHSVMYPHEGYGMSFENQWRREQGMDQRLFYKYLYGDVGLTNDDVFHWPTP